MVNASARCAGSMNSDQVVLDSKRCWSTSMIGTVIWPPGGRVAAPSRVGPVGAVPGRSRGLFDSGPQSEEPVVGGLPGRVRLAPVLGPVLASCGIRPQELHPGQPRMQVAQAVSDNLVADMPSKVDDEAVVAESLLCR